MDKVKLLKAIVETLEKSKGKRKFVQSIEVAVNFKDVNFSKPENRLNIDLALPYAAKSPKIAIFADGQLAVDAKQVCDKVIPSSEIELYAKDKKKQKELLSYTLLAAAPLMPSIGKLLGQFLGARGKLPKPIMPGGNVKDLVEQAKRSVSIKTKGKYLPTVHVVIGNENMEPEKLMENLQAILDAIEKKIVKHQITNVCIKSTMGPALKVINQ